MTGSMAAKKSQRQDPDEGIVGRRGDGYGSEYHLRKYLTQDWQDELDKAIRSAVGSPAARCEWLPYPARAAADAQDRELRGMEFLAEPGARDAWRGFWPGSGSPQTWDA